MQHMQAKRVSGVMKNLAAVALIAAAVLVWYLRRHGHSPAAAPATATQASRATATPGAPGAAAAAAAKPPEHATKLSPEERRQVADRIAAAHTVRHSVPAPPSLPAARPALDPADTEGFKTTIRSGMKEVIPMLADCYDKAGSSVGNQITVRAHLVLTGDPDIGTLIDANQLTDPQDATYPAGFDDCVRSTLQSIELPPLAEGDEVKVTYPFVFSRD